MAATITRPVLPLVQQKIWDGRLPLEIHLARDESRQYTSTPPYFTSVPRVSYLPLLLPRLHRYFSPSLIADPTTISPDEGYFTFDGVPLKWQFPIGLLYDMYVLAVKDPAAAAATLPSASAPASASAAATATAASTSPTNLNLPLVLTLHFNPPSNAGAADTAMATGAGLLINPTPVVLHDAFINSLKEADFVRSGTAKPIMSLPTSESKSLWTSTQANDLAVWAKVHSSLLPRKGQWRGIPLRIFLPVLDNDGSSDHDHESGSGAGNAKGGIYHHNNKYENNPTEPENAKPTAQIRVVQAHISPTSTPSTTAATAAAAARIPSQSAAGGGAGGVGQQQPTPTPTPTTLGSALNSLLPGLFPSRRTAVLARPILHGAPVPMGANLEDLARWCCYADGWLAVVIAVSG